MVCSETILRATHPHDLLAKKCIMKIEKPVPEHNYSYQNFNMWFKLPAGVIDPVTRFLRPFIGIYRSTPLITIGFLARLAGILNKHHQIFHHNTWVFCWTSLANWLCSLSRTFSQLLPAKKGGTDGENTKRLLEILYNYLVHSAPRKKKVRDTANLWWDFCEEVLC